MKAEIAGMLKPHTGQLDGFEKAMLDEFFSFVRENRSKTWLHWNMRDQNYGFAALEHRYSVLGGAPVSVPEDRRVDLARLLIALFGKQYASHPRLASVVDMNDISTMDFLTGKGESEAYEGGEFHKMHRSTLTKVDVLANIAGRAADGSLTTRTSKWTLAKVDYLGGAISVMPRLIAALGIFGSIASILAW